MNSWPTPEEVEAQLHALQSDGSVDRAAIADLLRKNADLLRQLRGEGTGMVDEWLRTPSDGNRYAGHIPIEIARHLEQLLSVARKEAAREERERCAKVADEFKYMDGSRTTLVAAAIRALPDAAKGGERG